MQASLIEVIQKFMRHDKDNGSPEVQIAILTHEITLLQSHLAEHAKDVDAKRSLLKKVARRIIIWKDLHLLPKLSNSRHNLLSYLFRIYCDLFYFLSFNFL